MRRKCHTCPCRTCLNVCKCEGCTGKKESCERYSGFRQLSIFEQQANPQYQSVPRHSWQHYGITKERYRQLTEYIQSGRYVHIVSQAAHRANETIAEYLIMSIAENKSYDALEKMWARGEIERIPCGKTNFYGIRRYFYSLFDKELKKNGEKAE